MELDEICVAIVATACIANILFVGLCKDFYTFAH